MNDVVIKKKYTIEDVELNYTDLGEYIRYGNLNSTISNSYKNKYNYMIGAYLYIDDSYGLEKTLYEEYDLWDTFRQVKSNAKNINEYYLNLMMKVDKFSNKSIDLHKRILKTYKNENENYINVCIEYFTKKIICDYLVNKKPLEYECKNIRLLKEIENFERGKLKFTKEMENYIDENQGEFKNNRFNGGKRIIWGKLYDDFSTKENCPYVSKGWDSTKSDRIMLITKNLHYFTDNFNEILRISENELNKYYDRLDWYQYTDNNLKYDLSKIQKMTCGLLIDFENLRGKLNETRIELASSNFEKENDKVNNIDNDGANKINNKNNKNELER